MHYLYEETKNKVANVKSKDCQTKQDYWQEKRVLYDRLINISQILIWFLEKMNSITEKCQFF